MPPERHITLRPSAVICDLTMLLLSAWTVICNAVVHTGGRPVHLARAANALLLALAVGIALGVRRSGWSGFLRRVTDAQGTEESMRAPGGTDDTGSDDQPLPPLALRAGLGLGALGCLALVPGTTPFFLATTGLMGTALVLSWRGVRSAAPDARFPEVAVWLLCALAAGAALCAHRPDHDDAFYLGAASSVARYPELALLSFDPIHGEGGPLQLAVYRVHSIELLAGLLSWETGVSVIYFMHSGLSGLGAVLLVLALCRLLRHLLPRRWPLALIAVLLIYGLGGGANRGYVNFALVRLYQGKAVFASAMVPLIAFYGLRFGQAPSAKRFVLLAASQVASLGLTASTLSIGPFVVAASVLAGVAESGRPLRTLAMGALSTAYVVATGIFFYVDMHHGQLLGPLAAQATAPAPVTGSGKELLLAKAYHLVLAEGPLGRLLLAGSLLAPVLSSTAQARRLWAVMGLFFFGILANPWLSGIIAGSLFGKAAYWRIFWALPMPVMLASAVASVGRRHWQALLATAMLAGALHLVTPRPVYAKRNRVTLGAPGHHAPPKDWAVAQALAELTPEDGRILAEHSVAQWLPAMSKRVYPLVVKKTYLRTQDRTDRRLLASCIEYKKRPRCTEKFMRELLVQFHPEVVVLRPSAQRAALTRILRSLDYRRIRTVSGRRIWVAPAGSAQR